MRGYVETAERCGMNPSDPETPVALRGHWRDGSVPNHEFCACPTPPASPQANIGNDADFARFVELGTRFSRRPLTDEEFVEYIPLWERAFPHLAPWRR